MTAELDGSGIAELAAFGPFFAVDWHPPQAVPGAPWRPVSELTGRSEALGARIASVRAALAASSGRDAEEIEPRVAGSAVHLGLAARLIAPALGAAVLRRAVDMRLGGLWWQDQSGGPVPLSVPAPAEDDNDLAPQERDRDLLLFDEVLVPVTEAIAGLVPVSGRVLWGNVASAVNAAAAQIARQRPDLADSAWQAAARFFRSPRLRGEPSPPGPAFRRASCCLFYRLAPGDRSAICGDCVLGGHRAR